ncbi:MAG TPA: hypothetical protein VHE32_14865 [Rhodanobacteraceae bacterium]|jgi:hypothetical protein|nr:hypothetical protein [Rhodanobacteraceae bacterium]
MIRWHFRTRARHPLMRLVAIVAGAAALAVVVAFGLVVAAALVVGGAAVLLAKALTRPSPGVATPPPSPDAAGGIIEGEFKVVADTRARVH